MKQIKFYIIGLIIAGLSIMSVSLQSKLHDATTQVEYLQGEVQYKQAEVNHLADAIEFGNAQHQLLVAERNRLALMRIEADQERERLRQELQATRNQINELRKSDNEQVQMWANTTVPGDACRLLKWSECADDLPDGDSDRSGLHGPAAGLNAALLTNRAF